MKQFHDSVALTVWNCEKGLKLCFGPYLQVVGASKMPSEDSFFFILKRSGFEAFYISNSYL